MVDSADDLTSMIDSLIDGDGEIAQQAFHNYLKPKIQSTVHPDSGDDSLNEE